VLFLFVLGATVGVFFDWLHVVSGTTAYASSGAWGQPLWVPLLFGGAGIGLGMGRLVTARWLRRPPVPVSGLEAIGALAAFFLAYVESAFVPDDVALLLLAVTGGGLFVWLDRSLVGALAALGAAVFGPLTEITLSRAGAFRYLEPASGTFVLGVPLWLPLLYVSASVSVGAIARWHARG
jgi:hypothetical protein